MSGMEENLKAVSFIRYGQWLNTHSIVTLLMIFFTIVSITTIITAFFFTTKSTIEKLSYLIIPIVTIVILIFCAYYTHKYKYMHFRNIEMPLYKLKNKLIKRFEKKGVSVEVKENVRKISTYQKYVMITNNSEILMSLGRENYKIINVYSFGGTKEEHYKLLSMIDSIVEPKLIKYQD